MTRSTSAVLRALAALGDRGDAMARTVRETPWYVMQALAGRRERHIGMITAIVTLLLYLVALGDLAVSVSGRWRGADTLQFAPQGLFQSRAPYLFEPVLAVYPSPHIAILLSPVNLALGAIVAALVGANIAVAAYGARRAVACRRPGYSRALGVLPAFLLGFACCVPTFVLLLGVGTAAAILPLVLPLQPVFYPLTLVLLISALIWGTHKIHQPPAD